MKPGVEVAAVMEVVVVTEAEAEAEVTAEHSVSVFPFRCFCDSSRPDANENRPPPPVSPHGVKESSSYLYVEASPKTERQRARLLSPAVAADTGPLCLLFSYQLQGEAWGALRVLLHDAQRDETVLWALRGDQGPAWKEGRTIVPRSPKDFQVVLEGVFDHGTRGHIWIDNVQMSASTPLEECTQFKEVEEAVVAVVVEEVTG
ncbi:hypothetical protein CRUP_009078 [Coryphaenoides rupestris]|nr:hypothetical protein CRUP_009078 [Coryphaenoides rupestris]